MSQYRFVFINIMGAEDNGVFTSEPVNSQELAEGQMNLVANYTLHLHECSLMPDYSNYGYIERFEDSVWMPIDEDEL